MKNFFDQKTINLMFLSVLLFIFGFLFFAFYNNWIIFYLPSYNVESLDKKTNLRQEKRDAALWYWKDGKWDKEDTNLLWARDSEAENIKYLINAWLNLVQDETLVSNLNNVLISSSGQQAYLSFDRNPLPQDCAIYQKLKFIEGILRTIRDNGISVQGIYFLVQHKIMQDNQLEFSKAWPITGFIG